MKSSATIFTSLSYVFQSTVGIRSPVDTAVFVCLFYVAAYLNVDRDRGKREMLKMMKNSKRLKGNGNIK
jgi:hypothetical protein